MMQAPDKDRTYEEGYLDGWLSVRSEAPPSVPDYKSIGVSRYRFGFEMGVDDANKRSTERLRP